MEEEQKASGKMCIVTNFQNNGIIHTKIQLSAFCFIFTRMKNHFFHTSRVQFHHLDLSFLWVLWDFLEGQLLFALDQTHAAIVKRTKVHRWESGKRSTHLTSFVHVFYHTKFCVHFIPPTTKVKETEMLRSPDEHPKYYMHRINRP